MTNSFENAEAAPVTVSTESSGMVRAAQETYSSSSAASESRSFSETSIQAVSQGLLPSLGIDMQVSESAAAGSRSNGGTAKADTLLASNGQTASYAAGISGSETTISCSAAITGAVKMSARPNSRSESNAAGVSGSEITNSGSAAITGAVKMSARPNSGRESNAAGVSGSEITNSGSAAITGAVKMSARPNSRSESNAAGVSGSESTMNSSRGAAAMDKIMKMRQPEKAGEPNAHKNEPFSDSNMQKFVRGYTTQAGSDSGHTVLRATSGSSAAAALGDGRAADGVTAIKNDAPPLRSTPGLAPRKK